MVAQSPEYDDWQVVTNDVWTDPNEARLEIFRVVERSNRSPSLGAFHRWPERQEWRFQVMMEETDPPRASFTSRGVEIPQQADREGRRFFSAVRRLLYRDTALFLGDTDQEAVMPPATEPRPETKPSNDLHEVGAPDLPVSRPPTSPRRSPDGLVEP